MIIVAICCDKTLHVYIQAVQTVAIQYLIKIPKLYLIVNIAKVAKTKWVAADFIVYWKVVKISDK